jgi:hypothetical protein
MDRTRMTEAADTQVDERIAILVGCEFKHLATHDAAHGLAWKAPCAAHTADFVETCTESQH